MQLNTLCHLQFFIKIQAYVLVQVIIVLLLDISFAKFFLVLKLFKFTCKMKNANF